MKHQMLPVLASLYQQSTPEPLKSAALRTLLLLLEPPSKPMTPSPGGTADAAAGVGSSSSKGARAGGKAAVQPCGNADVGRTAVEGQVDLQVEEQAAVGKHCSPDAVKAGMQLLSLGEV